MTPTDMINSNSTNAYSAFFWVVVCLLSFSLTACSDDSPLGTDDTIEISAEFSISNDEPTLGEEVTLNASASTISETGSSLQYTWTLTAPDDSEAELENTDTVETSFTADIGGEYEVNLEVAFDDLTDTEMKVIQAFDFEEINSNITENRTLFSDVLYRVTSGIEVSAELTIEPGTVIEFEENTGMQISENGVFIADGTEQDSIRFTGVEETPGFWDGISFNGSQSTSNLLNYAIIEYGGGDGYWTAQDIYANLTVGLRTSGSSSRLELRNSTLRYSGDVGLKVTNESSMPNAENNTYTDNSEGPVLTESPLIHYLSPSSDFTGNNGNDYVLVTDSTVEGDNRTWSALNVPYRMRGDFTVRDIDLTIAAGATFEFTNGSSFDFRGEGAFLADGNEDNFITFTGTEQEPGWWDGVHLREAMNPNNMMSHTIIEYAGGDEFWGTQDVNANLVIGGRTTDSAARLQVVNSRFYYSGGYGLKIAGADDSRMDDSGFNTYSDNSSGAVYLTANTMHYMDSDSDYTGNNGNDYVRVRSTSVEGTSKTWSALNVPYRMSGETRTEDIEITIDPGAVFEFTSGAGLAFRNGSEINAVGTEDNNILFTGTEEVDGWWTGVLIQTLSPSNVMEHITIEYGGGDGFWGTQDHYANLVIGHRTSDNAGRLDLTNSTFRNSDGYGIYVREDSIVNDNICEDGVNTFSDNAEGNCLIE